MGRGVIVGGESGAVRGRRLKGDGKGSRLNLSRV